jgi:hypothetical protein
MSIDTKKQILKELKQVKYLNKDREGFKADLVEYAKTFFPNVNEDYSENSFGGLLLDFAAYVGDVDSFYLDHQFHELDAETAVETQNIERELRKAGVPIVGSSPAVVDQTFIIEVPATGTPPDTASLPVVHAGTMVPGQNGTMYELTEDIDFSDTDSETGALLATIKVAKTNSSTNVPTSFYLSRKEICISGFRNSETFSIGSFTPFLRFALSKENITEIVDIRDNLGNVYYEVEYLTQDTVFKAIPNTNNYDDDLVKDTLVVVPAPYRFVSNMSLNSRLTSITLGGGSAVVAQDDLIPDPSEFSLPLFGKRTFSRFAINPGNLLKTNTLGIVVPNTNLIITYRYGGGLSHNAIPRSIRGVSNLIMSFPNGPTTAVSQFVRNSIDSINEREASGGEDAPTIDELKLRIPDVRASQSRIVTREDLLARIYTMPSNFGRVFRAAVHTNPNNPLAARLFIVSRNNSSQLITSPDSLKKNLARFLNQYRLSNDAMDILDAQVINLKLEFAITVDPKQNRNIVLQNVLTRLKSFFNVKNFSIDQPIVYDDIQNIIYNTLGVLSVESLALKNVNGTIGANSDARQYSTVQFDAEANTLRKILYAPIGSIFEMKYPDYDLIGTVR